MNRATVGQEVRTILGVLPTQQTGVVTRRNGEYVYVRMPNGAEIEFYDCELEAA